MRHRGPVAGAALFFLFACAFSVALWPGVPLVAKLAFFAAGIGCGASIARLGRRAGAEK